MVKFFIHLLAILLLISCVKDRCSFRSYVFEIPATLAPAQSVYSIGDTITISSVFSDEVYDRATGRNYDLLNYQFHPITTFERLDTLGIDTIENVTEDHFEFLVEPNYEYFLQNSYSDGSDLSGQFNYLNGQYELEYKLVAKKKGLYLTYFSSLLYFQRNNQEFSDRCDNVLLDSWTVLNDGADNNDELLLEAVEDVWHRHYNEATLNRNFQKLGGYVIKVE